METSLNAGTAPNQIARLTQGLAAGDEAAFREFHAQYFQLLYRFLLVTCRGQQEEAREALQQTFLRVVRYIRRFESEEVFWSWLKAVARSAARDGNRKQQRYAALLHRFAFSQHPPETGATTDNESRLSNLLEEGLAELTADDRHLLEAKYVEGFTVKELAVQAGLTEKSVESRLERLRRCIRDGILKKLAKP